jgi:hypothetical protein
LLHRAAGGFDVADALVALEGIYGIDESIQIQPEPPRTKKRQTDDAALENDSIEKAEHAPKVKKTDTVKNENNRAIAEAIKDIADVYYKNKDIRKGGVFSKAAKAIRETDIHLISGKVAMKLDGVGKGIAAYVDEFNEHGFIKKLEELRAGTA